MLISSSPETLARLRVSTPMKPWITVPLGAFGVMVSVMVPVWPGLRVSGEYGADALTLAGTRPARERHGCGAEEGRGGAVFLREMDLATAMIGRNPAPSRT